jgi:hypothetical protein
MAEVADSIAGQTGERSAHKEEYNNWLDGVGFIAGLLAEPEKNRGLDNEIDDPKRCFFVWVENSNEKCCHPLCVETDPNSYAVDVGVASEGTWLACRSHCGALMRCQGSSILVSILEVKRKEGNSRAKPHPVTESLSSRRPNKVF